MTPSGLSIGTNLKTNMSQSFTATGSSEIMNQIMPYIMNEEFDSPGCTHPVAITAFLSDISHSLELKFVTISNSIEFPALVFVSSVFQTISFLA